MQSVSLVNICFSCIRHKQGASLQRQNNALLGCLEILTHSSGDQEVKSRSEIASPSVFKRNGRLTSGPHGRGNIWFKTMSGQKQSGSVEASVFHLLLPQMDKWLEQQNKVCQFCYNIMSRSEMSTLPEHAPCSVTLAAGCTGPLSFLFECCRSPAGDRTSRFKNTGKASGSTGSSRCVREKLKTRKGGKTGTMQHWKLLLSTGSYTSITTD